MSFLPMSSTIEIRYTVCEYNFAFEYCLVPLTKINSDMCTFGTLKRVNTLGKCSDIFNGEAIFVTFYVGSCTLTHLCRVDSPTSTFLTDPFPTNG